MKNKLALLLLVVVFMSGCSSEPRLQPLSPSDTVLAFGDSLTEGRGAASGEGYPEVLAGMSGLRVVNAGISGELSAEGLERLPAVLDEVRPALLILCHGGNDLLQKSSLEDAEQNLRVMIALARERNIPVVLLGVPRPAIFLSTADFYDDIAETNEVIYVRDIVADVLGDGDLRTDVAHPNAAGYRLIAETVYDELVAAGALPGR